LLEKSIPIRTFTEWQADYPDFMEVDLVCLCGESTQAFHTTTLSTVDLAAGWAECSGLWGKNQHVGAASHNIRQRLPFPLRCYLGQRIGRCCRAQQAKSDQSSLIHIPYTLSVMEENPASTLVFPAA